MNLTVLGSQGAIPKLGKYSTSLLLNISNSNILIDCCEGVQHQLRKYKIKLSKIDIILISHAHGDHYFGLIGLISTLSLLKRDKKLIHFSTDCVFDGKKGNYLDDDKPDEKGIYGKSKAMGEIISKNTLVIRTSIIGRELFNHTELFEWLFSMKNRKIQGYKNVIFS